jgi:hypothetical protein
MSQLHQLERRAGRGDDTQKSITDADVTLRETHVSSPPG